MGKPFPNCCSPGSCCDQTGNPDTVTVHLSNFIKCCSFANGTYSLVRDLDYPGDPCRWKYEQTFSAPADPCGADTGTACLTVVHSPSSTSYYYQASITIWAHADTPTTNQGANLTVDLQLTWSKWSTNSSGQCLEAAESEWTRYGRTTCNNGPCVPILGQVSNLPIIGEQCNYYSPSNPSQTVVGTVEIEL